MSQFFASTWPLWLVLILLMIFRWFHVVTAGSRLPDDETSLPRMSHTTAIDFS